VECRFQVDFYGYDLGDLNATATFSVHPPTGSPTVVLTDTIFIGQDAAGGGTDLDASREYRCNRSSATTRRTRSRGVTSSSK
jgi:hypothetical protein